MSASTQVSLDDTSPRASMSRREEQVAALTGLRGFAALMVVLVHSTVRTQYPWLGLPSYGPVALFVLSGFLLYRPWARWTLRLGSSPDVFVYSRRRLSRIFPAYLVMLFIVALVYPPARPVGADGWFYSVTLTWIYVRGHFPDVLAHTWSLATEVSWYVALPMMAGVSGLIARRFAARTALRITTGLIALSLPVTIGWEYWIYANHLAIYFTYSFWLPAFLVCFAGGALVALYMEAYAAGITSLPRLRRLTADRWAVPLFVVGIALLGTSVLGGSDGYVPHTFGEDQVRFASVTTIALSLLTAVVFGPANAPVARLMSSTVLATAGRWSYGIYLWHLPVIVILDQRLTYPDGAVANLVMRLVWVLGISVPLAAATYAWVEKPAIDWSRRPMAFRAADSRHRSLPGRRNAENTDATPSTESNTATTAQPTDAANTVRERSLPDE
ncbi:acyltransferase family protein [Nocardioides sp. URHA0020]|uniref:acyltransferase family protein n=1 Tax=Nocardioides sp. URHA0020 TaxID=1380392 RepID=UPI0009DD3B7F|nr:acyltransferase [Nocardioides sp. URHA0020]